MDNVSKIFEVGGGNEELKAVMDSLNEAAKGHPEPIVMASLIALLAMAADKVSQREKPDPDLGMASSVNMFGSIVGFDYAISFRRCEECAEGQAVH